MAITLATLTLPEDLLWQDEFLHDAVAQNTTRTEGGALIVEESAITAGRPITLVGGADAGWMTRSDLIALRALADAAATTRLLTLNDGRTFNVMFARPAIEAEPIIAFNFPVAADFYAVTLKLFTV